MQALHIRQATPADLPAILALYRNAGIGDDANFTLEEATAHLALLHANPLLNVFVAEHEGKVAATYELLIMENLAKRGLRSAIVEDVAVDPTLQGRGIGRALMLHAREQARNAGCYKLMLSSNQRREDAHRFYDSLGFERHGVSFLIRP